jgi:hypothetical protein
MDSNTRKFVVLGSAVLIVVLLVGLGLKSMIGRPKQASPVQSAYPQMPAGYTLPPGVNLPAGMGMPAGMAMPPGMKLPRAAMAAFANILPPSLVLDAGEQQALNKLVAEQHLTRRAAAYLVKSKIQLIDESKTSQHFLMTFPDGATIDEKIVLTPNQSYSPTAQDLEKAARRRSRVYNPHLKFTKKGPESALSTMEYAVPYSALPKEILERIGGPGQSTAAFFDLVPRAEAQARSVVEPSIAVATNVLAEHWKGIDAAGEEFETGKSLGIDAPLAIFDLVMSMGELSGQVGQISAMQDCANNPTNPLTQKASQDPNYQHDVLDPLSEAKGDVGSSALPRAANVAAGYLTHFLPFGSGAALAPILGMNDDAINSINEQRIQDAEKLVVECEKETELEAMGYRPMDGKFEYKFNGSYRNCTKSGSESGCTFSTNVIEEQGTFIIDPNATEESAAAANRGSGSSKDDGGFENPKCSGESHTVTSGSLKVSVEVMGPPEAAVLRLSAGSDEWTGTLDSSDNCSIQSKPQHQTWRNAGAPGVNCKFTKINMIKGGHFATFSEADRGHGACTIDLERK